jgi:integrase/recombinase XerD
MDAYLSLLQPREAKYLNRPTSINNLLRSLAAWTDWMLAAGFTDQEFLVGFEECKLGVEQQRVLYSRGSNHYSVTAASVSSGSSNIRVSFRSLQLRPSPSDLWPWLGEFRSCMRKHVALLIRHSMFYYGITISLRKFHT